MNLNSQSHDKLVDLPFGRILFKRTAAVELFTVSHWFMKMVVCDLEQCPRRTMFALMPALGLLTILTHHLSYLVKPLIS